MNAASAYHSLAKTRQEWSRGTTTTKSTAITTTTPGDAPATRMPENQNRAYGFVNGYVVASAATLPAARGNPTPVKSQDMAHIPTAARPPNPDPAVPTSPARPGYRRTKPHPYHNPTHTANASFTPTYQHPSLDASHIRQIWIVPNIRQRLSQIR